MATDDASPPQRAGLHDVPKRRKSDAFPIQDIDLDLAYAQCYCATCQRLQALDANEAHRRELLTDLWRIFDRLRAKP